MMIRAITNTLNQTYFKGIYGNELQPSKYYLRSKMPEIQNDAFIKTSRPFPVLKPNDISFGYNFELKNPRGIPCAYCGKETLSTDEVYHMQDLKGKELVRELEKFASQKRSALNPVWRSALYSFEKTALDNSNLNGKDLLPVAYTRARTRMLIKQAEVYAKIEHLASVLDSKELAEYIDKVKEQDVSLNPDISLEELSDFLINKIHVQFRKEVVDNVKKIAGDYKESEQRAAWGEIIRTINNLPSSKNDPDAFLVKFISKAIRKDPKIENELVPLSASSAALFYSKLLFPFASSAEHIKPYSDNGDSHFSNYLVTHVHCNSDRGSEPWAEFMLCDAKKFDNILLNLQTISKTPEIQKSLKEIKVPVYIKQVKNQILKQLTDVKDDDNVERFIEGLTSIGEVDSDAVFLYPDAMIKNSVEEKLLPILKIPDSKERNEVLEKSLKSNFEKFKRDRVRLFDRFVAHLDDGSPGVILKDYMLNLQAYDPILTMETIDFEKLNKILSNNYAQVYKAKMEKDLSQLYSTPVKDERLKKVIKDIPRKYLPCKGEKAYYIKVLLAARVGENEYDIDKINFLLAQSANSGCQRRPSSSRIEKLKRMGIASAF